MGRVIVTKRSYDWHAHIEGNEEVWERGFSPEEAVGALIRKHGSYFAEVVLWDGDKSAQAKRKEGK